MSKFNPNKYLPFANIYRSAINPFFISHMDFVSKLKTEIIRVTLTGLKTKVTIFERDKSIYNILHTFDSKQTIDFGNLEFEDFRSII